MTGLTEEGGKVAHGVIEGLKSQPISLALIVINIVFVVFTWYIAHEINQRTEHQYEVKDQLISKLLEQCAKGNRSSL